MPVPADPFDFVNQTVADAEQVDARFAPLYAALDGALDESNLAVKRGTFSAYLASALALSTNPQTPLVLDGERFDVSGWFDSATGLFTPQVAGYYRFSWLVSVSPGASGQGFVAGLVKNGLLVAQGSYSVSVAGHTQSSGGSAVMVANGSTDAFGVEARGTVPNALTATAHDTFFCGELIGRS